MIEKAKKNNKNLIIGICVGAFILALIIVVIIFVNQNAKLNDDYFVSDNTKYVLTINGGMIDNTTTEIPPVNTHIVYYYSDDTINGMSIYTEFTDGPTASTALESYKNTYQNGAKNIYINDKYIVIEMSEGQYSDMTVSDVKSQIELIEKLKNIDPTNIEENSEETMEIEENNS